MVEELPMNLAFKIHLKLDGCLKHFLQTARDEIKEVLVSISRYLTSSFSLILRRITITVDTM